MINDSETPSGPSITSAGDRLGREVAWDVSHDLHVIVDRQGVVRDLNPAWKRMLGLEASLIIGKPLTTLAHPADAETIGLSIAELAEDGDRA